MAMRVSTEVSHPDPSRSLPCALKYPTPSAKRNRQDGFTDGTALPRLELKWWDIWDAWANAREQVFYFQPVIPFR